MSAAAVLLAAALLAAAGPTVTRRRAGVIATAPRAARSRPAGADPLAEASAFDVLAVCLGAGMTVSAAAAATAASAPAHLGVVLRRAADRIDAVTLTLDTHHRRDIAHPGFWWAHAPGQEVAPFTPITAAQRTRAM
mgnify:FL=1